MLIGLVGAPNAGKSTLFKALSLAPAQIASYPFTTIKPNFGVGFVRVNCVEKEFGVKCNPREGFCVDGIRFVPVKLIDVAGLVPGASKGKGMGNQFLDDLRQADALIHVVDVSGVTNNPVEDVAFLEEEIDAWLFSILNKNWSKLVHKNLKPEEAITAQLSGMKIKEAEVKQILKNFPPSLDDFTAEDVKKLASEVRKKSMPILVAANKIDVDGKAEKNLEKIRKQFPQKLVIGCSAEFELALKEAAETKIITYVPGSSHFEIIKSEQLNEKQKIALEKIKNFLDVHKTTGVQETLEAAVFKLLNYIAVYPVPNNKLKDSEGRILPDCYLVPPNTNALEFASIIHSEFAEKFIKAIDVKTNRTLGKEHVLKNNDVIEIVTSR